MSQPMFFDPDPTIDDADQLGYGHLIFDDGHSEWLNGDPEMAAALPPPPAANDIAAQGPAANPADQSGQVGGQFSGVLNDIGKSVDPIANSMFGVPDAGSPPAQAQMPPAVPIPGTDHSIDPSTGTITPGGAAQGGPTDGGSSAPQMPSAVPIPGTPHAVDPSTGNIIPNGAAQSGLGSGGLQVSQREGALPPGMAAEQRNQIASSNQEVFDATQASRQNEGDLYRQAAVKRAGELDAEKAAQEAQLKENLAKQDRLQAERQQIAGMDIKTDLISAEGAIGSVFSIVGAAMLGAVHSDAGLRMIENTIDRNVKLQVGKRDTQLHMLSEDLGSTQQAIAAGKAQLYKLAADRAENMIQMTKADAFIAQTPAVLTQLRQKQQEEEQKFDQLSLGKTTEKPPAPNEKAMTQYQQAKLTQGYGKAAAGQDEATRNALRALDAVGGHWDPKTQTITNKAEILKEGIPGVGKVDSFLQGVPGLRNIDNMVTSDKGLAVRAALADLVAAKAMEQNPGRAPSDADRDAAASSLGLGTEQGTLNAIERIMREQGEHKAENVATFGKGAADSYNNRLQQQGGQAQTTQGAPLDIRPAQPGQARQQLEQDRQQQTQMSPQQKMQEVASDVQAIAGKELPPEGLAILTAQAAHETRNGEAAPGNNYFGHKAKTGEQSQSLTTTEGEGANAKQLKQNFRTFPNAGESVQAHVELLKNKYPDAWRALQSGDVDAYVAALKDGGYFTGNETLYLNSLKARL